MRKKIQFETSTFCNARCTFCPRYEMTRPTGFMSDEMFHKIIKEAKEMGIKQFSPFLNGEPFVFPKIYEWLDYMEKEGCEVVLYTNAEFMDVKKLRKYKNIKLINCSVNAATKETYDKIMRGPNFDRVIKNVQELLKEPFCEVKVGFIKMLNNYHEKGKFRDMWGEHANFLPFANWTGARKPPTTTNKIKRKCSRVARHITILWDGRVNLCCMDFDGKLIFGDLNKESLAEIEEKKKDIIEKHANGDFSMYPCNVCNYNTM